MKVGDLVKSTPDCTVLETTLIGIITMYAEYDDTGEWYRVDWNDGDFLWHRPGDLELISES